MSYGKEQYFMIAAAALFLVGAVFMLLNTFGGMEWALWAGLVFAVAAFVVWVIVMFEQHRFGKKFSPTKAEQEAIEQVVISPVAVPTPAIKEVDEIKKTESPKTTPKTSKKTTEKPAEVSSEKPKSKKTTSKKSPEKK